MFKEKNSKFYGFAFQVLNEDDVKYYLKLVKKEHRAARHWCYAYQTGTEQKTYRVNDDGEPSNSAGTPIYGQILSFGLTNVLIIVVRYFGGVKLGVGGLVQAYKTTAQLTIEASSIKKKTINETLSICFQYQDMNKVMRIIKEKQLVITSQKLELTCCLCISVRKQISNEILDIFDAIYGVTVKKL